jgi:arsenical pump membrane protein
VLVTGLILIGNVAATEGLFGAIGVRLAGTRLGPRRLLIAMLVLVAGVTAVLNLDTAVVFLTPVLVHAARERGLDERPFLYGSVFTANSASVFLPGANLTNLLVLRNQTESVTSFALRMLPAGAAACTVTVAFFAVAFRFRERRRPISQAAPIQLGLGATATAAAAVAVVALPDAALPVLAIGIATTAARRIRPRLGARALIGLFVLAVAVGTIGRVWSGAAALDHAGPWTAAALGATTSVLLNNLPASALLSARPVSHPHALLLGLDIGPNLAVTGSLSALLWLRAARMAGARTSVVTYSRFGFALVPLTLVAALAALRI